MNPELLLIVLLVLASLPIFPASPAPSLLVKAAEMLRQINPANLRKIEETLTALKPLVFTMATLIAAIVFSVAYIIHEIEGIGK